MKLSTRWVIVGALMAASMVACKDGKQNAEAVKESATAPTEDGEGEGGPGMLAKKLAAKPKGEAPAADTDPAKPEDDGWMALSSSEGRFRARFPRPPSTEVSATPTDIGNVDLHTTSIADDDGFLAVSYADYPKELVADGVASKLLDGARDGMVKNMGGKITREDQITLDGHPGRAFEMSATVQGMSIVASARIYLVENRLYQNLVLRPSLIGIDAESKKFMDSFQLGAQ